jgi:short-subunit dehydrogenase
MSIPLQGKTILITGASSGIGEATVKACIRAGMRCVITARREERLEQIASELGELCIPIAGDVTEPGFNELLLQEAGDVYAIFINAGHGLDQQMTDCNMNQFRELFELNLFAAIELASIALPTMVERGNGHILLCASCLSKFALPNHAAYCASKSAMEAVAKTMRLELRGRGVKVSTVHPIGTRTEFFDASATRSGKIETEFKPPSWFMQPPDKVARAVVRCLRRPRPEVWTSVPMRFISTIFTAFPRVAEVLLSRFS